jgi:amino acid adenylation domain-containing protein
MVKREVLNASEHPNFTFGKLLERMTVDRSRMPLISTIFNIDQPMPPLDFGGPVGTLRTVPRAAENFEMFLNVLPLDKKLTVETTYSTALFSEPTIEAWLNSLECVLSHVISQQTIRISDIPLARSFPEVLRHSNATSVDIRFSDFVSAFRNQVKLTPEAPAVLCLDRTLTYEQLDRRSDAVVSILASKGVREGDVVGLCCERSEKMVICIAALLKLGAAYLPLDPDFPQERLLYMLEDSGAAAVIEDEASPQSLRDLNILHFDMDGFEVAVSTDAVIHTLADNPDRLAYMIYTSGSTGKPKGVRVPTRAMVNFLESMVREPGCSSTDRLLAVTTLSFDISVLELFVPLISGACTVVATREQAKDGGKLVELISAHKITLMQATPSTWRMLLMNDWKDDDTTVKLKALCGGEPLPPDLVADLLSKVAELWNMYGPTETTVWSTCKRIFSPNGLITIGKPIANTQIYILDKNGNDLPLSAPGELYIGGAGVTLGYHNRAELNAQRFIFHPAYGRIYATGDLAKVLPNGEIQHLGRLDDQVKLRGYRIELGEIESALVNCPGVHAAAVYLWELSSGDVRIVACCVPQAAQQLEINSIRKQLRKTLPNYMVPQYFMEVGSIPLTPNGKVNRRALPRPEETKTSILAKSVPITDTEKVIGKIWKDLVKTKQPIGREDNFFEIGGHSLLALLAIREIEHATGKKITPAEIITMRLWEIADKISADAGKSEAAQSGPSALSSAAVRGVSPEQKRILKRQLAYPDSTCNNLLGAWVIEGDLDLEAFIKSLHRVYERQTALRTVIQPYHDDFRQVLQHVNTVDLPEFEDCSTEDDPFESALRKTIEYVQKPFFPLNRILSRAKLFRLDRQKYLFAIANHQLIFDGWSYDIFLGELESGYRGLTEGTALSAGSLPFEFRDYAQWCNTRDLNLQHLDFYRRAIERRLKFSFSLDSRSKGLCAERVFKLPVVDLEKIEAFCSTHQLRLHEFLFAVFAQAVCEFSAESSVTLGLPVSGRYAPEVINLVGSFVTVLPCEVRMDGGNFPDIARNVAHTMKVFYGNQSVSYAEIVRGTERETEYFPAALPASFSFQDVRNRPTKLGNLGLTQINLPRKQTELPIEYWTRVHPDGITIGFDYDSGLVDSNAIDSLASRIELIVHNALDQKMESVPIAREQRDRIEPAKPLWRKLFSKVSG